jgi:membrane protein YdbS with pleckstrin-like domain
MEPGSAVAVPRLEPPLRPPAHQVSPRAVRWWRLKAAITTVVLTLPQVVGLLVFDPPVATVLTVAAVLTVLVGVAYLLLVPPLQYRIHRWEITDDAVYTLSGWLNREWRIAPISRVQTVDTGHGPLQQLLGLATVAVTTASARGTVDIVGLDADVAAELARMLTETTQATPGDAT